jgi:hypothetical protein
MIIYLCSVVPVLPAIAISNANTFTTVQLSFLHPPHHSHCHPIVVMAVIIMCCCHSCMASLCHIAPITLWHWQDQGWWLVVTVLRSSPSRLHTTKWPREEGGCRWWWRRGRRKGGEEAEGKEEGNHDERCRLVAQKEKEKIPTHELNPQCHSPSQCVKYEMNI